MKILINYANVQFLTAQKKCSQTGTFIGKFDKVIEYGFQDLDENFKLKNKLILKSNKGAGYWIWKPYIIRKTLLTMTDNDFLFYCDSGSCFIQSVQPYIDYVVSKNIDLLAFIMPSSNFYFETRWCKGDVLKELGVLERKDILESPQIMSTYSLWRKTEKTLQFVEKWLELCQNRQLVTDIPSIVPNFPNFEEHRHDQAIFSVLCKINNIDTVINPSYPDLISCSKGLYRIVNGERDSR